MVCWALSAFDYFTIMKYDKNISIKPKAPSTVTNIWTVNISILEANSTGSYHNLQRQSSTTVKTATVTLKNRKKESTVLKTDGSHGKRTPCSDNIKKKEATSLKTVAATKDEDSSLIMTHDWTLFIRFFSLNFLALPLPQQMLSHEACVCVCVRVPDAAATVSSGKRRGNRGSTLMWWCKENRRIHKITEVIIFPPSVFLFGGGGNTEALWKKKGREIRKFVSICASRECKYEAEETLPLFGRWCKA